ncbi:MAG: 3-phosphoshikimate 1-carboxyvinyltransferase [Megasphaera sp.]|jgi:3-phosphoshikimate 1-carboxyvinyltransferase|nr:3-phosphoshikimate 1-carboxyvinyltransferase [Megasphaera sp.]MCI1248533.1 3-phosphoshikimate 1-carboxyvinyltransferase [Megasphaera sp.]
MKVTITPQPLGGSIQIPSSKSMGHRDLICAALASGESYVENISSSQDIEATCHILQALGATIKTIQLHRLNRTAYRIQGGLRKWNQPVVADCGESGSTLRFFIPIGLLTGNIVTFTGRGRLADRPLDTYFNLFRQKGIDFKIDAAGKNLPLTVQGTLQPGMYALPGNVSSQFFTGLLLALPLLAGDSVLTSTTPLESASYIDMTLTCMDNHGVHVQSDGKGKFHIPGNQNYQSGRYIVEGDYSQAAFWLAAGVLSKHKIICTGLRPRSCQGDMAIVPILKAMGGHFSNVGSMLTAHPSVLSGRTIDVRDCPDLTPVLAAAAACSKGTTHIIHAARVRLKECDRLHAMAVELTKLGADIQEEPDGLVIHGVAALHGGIVSSWNDHRIAMALAIVSQRCQGTVTIEEAESVRKSYPDFWKDFAKAGGVYKQEG